MADRLLPREAETSKLKSMRVVLISAMACLLAAPIMAQQQSDSGSAAQQTAAKKKSPASHKQSATQANPFPEAQSKKAAEPTQDQQLPAAPPPVPPKPKRSAAEENPFPQAQSEKAAQADHSQQPQQSSQNEGSSSSRVEGLVPPAWDPKAVPNRRGGYQLNPKLAEQDLKVGEFYLQSGNYKGAYDRFVEAKKVNPGSAEAVFGLAESARHLNLRDEALRNYRLYLDALPNGRYAKQARKALKQMGAGS